MTIYAPEAETGFAVESFTPTLKALEATGDTPSFETVKIYYTNMAEDFKTAADDPKNSKIRAGIEEQELKARTAVETLASIEALTNNKARRSELGKTYFKALDILSNQMQRVYAANIEDRPDGRENLKNWFDEQKTALRAK